MAFYDATWSPRNFVLKVSTYVRMCTRYPGVKIPPLAVRRSETELKTFYFELQ